MEALLAMTQTQALVALDANATELARNGSERDSLMARARVLILAADAAGVDRTTIINRSGLSRRTVYKILGES